MQYGEVNYRRGTLWLHSTRGQLHLPFAAVPLQRARVSLRLRGTLPKPDAGLPTPSCPSSHLAPVKRRAERPGPAGHRGRHGTQAPPRRRPAAAQPAPLRGRPPGPPPPGARGRGGGTGAAPGRGGAERSGRPRAAARLSRLFGGSLYSRVRGSVGRPRAPCGADITDMAESPPSPPGTRSS